MFRRVRFIVGFVVLLAIGAWAWLDQNPDWDPREAINRAIDAVQESSLMSTASTNAPTQATSAPSQESTAVVAIPIQNQVPTASPITEAVLGKYPTTVPLPVAPTPTVTPNPEPQPLTGSSLTETILAKYATTVPLPDSTPKDSSPLTNTQTVTPTPTRVGSPALRIAPTVTPAHTQTPVPTSTLVSPPTPFPEWTPTPTQSPTPTPHPAPALRHLEYKELMLDLVNKERTEAGLQPVELGDNAAAQIHAEGALRGCYSSHWDSDGLKPYMRYTLAGGYQSNSENGHGRDYCVRDRDGYRAIESVSTEVREAVEGWMQSSGHRRNILRPWHRKLNIGIAFDTYNFLAYQHFEGDYVRYEQIPEIRDGNLAFSGELLNGSGLAEREALGIQIYYDPPPHDLTAGQLARTYCYDNGLRVASFSPPLPPGWSYPDDSYTYEYDPCPNPYDVPADASAAQSHDEAHELWKEAYEASQSKSSYQVVIPWIVASEWEVSSTSFRVVADVSDVISQYRTGVYTVMVWADLGDDREVVSQFSIFYGIDPPDTYNTATGE